MTQYALEVNGLVKAFKGQKAVDGLSFAIEKGSVWGLLGPNGAGKTTSIRMVSGLLKPDAGHILLNGKPLGPSTISGIGLCPQELAIWDNLTVQEQLLYVASLYDIPRDLAKKRAAELLDALKLTEQKNKLAYALSGGMKRRLNIMLALMHDPELIILDEPQAGLDPQSRLLVRDYIRSLKGTKTVLITTHDMEEAEKLSDQVAIIDHGRILASDSPQGLKAKYTQKPLIQLRWSKGQAAFDAVMAGFLSPYTVTTLGDQMMIQTADPFQGIAELVRIFGETDTIDAHLELRQPTLEDLFIQLTGRGLRE